MLYTERRVSVQYSRWVYSVKTADSQKDISSKHAGLSHLLQAPSCLLTRYCHLLAETSASPQPLQGKGAGSKIHTKDFFQHNNQNKHSDRGMPQNNTTTQTLPALKMFGQDLFFLLFVLHKDVHHSVCLQPQTSPTVHPTCLYYIFHTYIL